MGYGLFRRQSVRDRRNDELDLRASVLMEQIEFASELAKVGDIRLRLDPLEVDLSLRAHVECVVSTASVAVRGMTTPVSISTGDGYI